MLRAVLFDLDGTLLDRESSVRAFASEQHSRLRALQHIEKERYISRFVTLDSHGAVWKDAVYRTLVGELNILGLGWRELLQDYESMFSRSCIPFPGLLPTLASLKTSGFLMGIVTNGPTLLQLSVIRALELEPFFGATLVSEAEGVRKPEQAIFDRALGRLGVRAEMSVFVGDNPEADIAGAKRAGMKAVWKRNSIWPAPENADATITDLSELIKVVPSLMLSNEFEIQNLTPSEPA